MRTHDHRFDVPALIAGLSADVGHLGAMGSGRAHADRTARLRAEGIVACDPERIHVPTGHDLGARTPDETAIPTCAEIIATRTGRAAPSLRDTERPLH